MLTRELSCLLISALVATARPRYKHRGIAGRQELEGGSTTTLAGSANATATPTTTVPSPTALALASPILASAPPACTVPGGGCSIWQSSLAGCQDDQCVCGDTLTLAAQVCAQCSPDSTRVQAYNRFLAACVSGGLAHPNQTLTVSAVSTTGTPSASGEPTGTNHTPPTTTPLTPSTTATNPVLIEGVTVLSTSNSLLTDLRVYTTSTLREGSWVVTVATGSPRPSSTPATLALEASRSFFAQTIDPTCAADCATWQDGLVSASTPR